MKLVTNLFIVSSLFVVACGPTKNDPLQKYKHLNLAKDQPTTSQKVVYKYQDKYIKGDKEIVYVPVPVATPVNNQVLVYVNNCPEGIAKEGESLSDCAKRLTDYTPQISLNGPVFEVKAYSDQNLQNEATVIFKEGQETSYFLVAKILYKSLVNFELNFENLPVGATAEEVESPEDDNLVKYKITWKPGMDVLKGDKVSETSSISTTLTNIEYKDTAENNYIMQITMNEIAKSMDVPVVLVSSEVSELQEEPTAQKTSVSETDGGRR